MIIRLINLIITKAKAKVKIKAKAKAKTITKAKAKAKGLKRLKRGKKENRIRAEGLLPTLTNRNQNIAVTGRVACKQMMPKDERTID